MRIRSIIFVSFLICWMVWLLPKFVSDCYITFFNITVISSHQNPHLQLDFRSSEKVAHPPSPVLIVSFWFCLSPKGKGSQSSFQAESLSTPQSIPVAWQDCTYPIGWIGCSQPRRKRESYKNNAFLIIPTNRL